jgi:hypothetical protein
MVDYEIGCVLFLDVKIYEHNSKMIKIPNGNNGIGYSKSKGFFKVKNFNDLEKDIIWITNFPQEFFDYFKLKCEHIKPENFFKIKLNSIIYEIGITDVHRQIVAKEIAELSNNIIKNLQNNYDLILDKHTLTESLISSFKLRNIDKNHFTSKLEINYKEENFFITDQKREQNEVQFYLNFSRYNYTRELCKNSYPVGDWVYLGIDEGKIIDYKNKTKNISIFTKISKNNEFAYEFISKYHALIHVKLTNIDKSIINILPNNYKKGKIWINDYEYLFLSKYCNIYIEELYVTKNKKFLKDIEPKKLFKVNNIEKNSISVGLGAYNYLYSFLDVFPKSNLSNWIKINDRIKMLNAAIEFQKNDIKVLSYGNSGILISVEKENIYNIIKIAEKLNLIYPTIIISDYL